jgi:hypothetical protein
VLLLARWRFKTFIDALSLLPGIYVDAICLSAVAVVFFGVRRFY